MGAAAHRGDAAREAFSSCQPQNLCKICVVRVEVITERNAAENVLAVCKFGQKQAFWGSCSHPGGEGAGSQVLGPRERSALSPFEPPLKWEWETGPWQRPFKTLSFARLTSQQGAASGGNLLKKKPHFLPNPSGAWCGARQSMQAVGVWLTAPRSPRSGCCRLPPRASASVPAAVPPAPRFLQLHFLSESPPRSLLFYFISFFPVCCPDVLMRSAGDIPTCHLLQAGSGRGRSRKRQAGR